MCPQDRVEAILLRRLQALGGGVERPCKVADLHQRNDEVQVQLESGEEVHARWVVGCDGVHSVVRERASIPFEGGAYDESFVLADLEMDWPLDRDEVNLFYSEKGLMVVAPMPENRFRMVATVQEAPAEPSIEYVESLLRERGPQDGSITIRRLGWTSRFHLQHRVAKVMRQDRILLAGGAAHVHSPAGGQGMNTGIQDAVSLASALRQNLQTGDEKILDEWQTHRLKIAHSVVSLTDRMTKMATVSSPLLKHLRNMSVEWIGHFPSAQHALAKRLSELSN